MVDNKVTPEVAADEFLRICEFARIDLAEVEADNAEADDAAPAGEADAVRGWTKGRRKICKAIQRGELTVDDVGIPTFKPSASETVAMKFSRVTGRTLQAGSKASDDATRMGLTIGQLTGLNPGTVSRLEANEWGVCSALASVFLKAL